MADVFDEIQKNRKKWKGSGGDTYFDRHKDDLMDLVSGTSQVGAGSVIFSFGAGVTATGVGAWLGVPIMGVGLLVGGRGAVAGANATVNMANDWENPSPTEHMGIFDDLINYNPLLSGPSQVLNTAGNIATFGPEAASAAVGGMEYVADKVARNQANQAAMADAAAMHQVDKAHLNKYGLDKESVKEFNRDLTPEQRKQLQDMSFEEQKQFVDEWKNGPSSANQSKDGTTFDDIEKELGIDPNNPSGTTLEDIENSLGIENSNAPQESDPDYYDRMDAKLQKEEEAILQQIAAEEAANKAKEDASSGPLSEIESELGIDPDNLSGTTLDDIEQELGIETPQEQLSDLEALEKQLGIDGNEGDGASLDDIEQQLDLDPENADSSFDEVEDMLDGESDSGGGDSGSSGSVGKDLSQDDGGSGSSKAAKEGGEDSESSGAEAEKDGVKVSDAGSGGSGGTGGGGSGQADTDSNDTNSDHTNKEDTTDPNQAEDGTGAQAADGENSADSATDSTQDAATNPDAKPTPGSDTQSSLAPETQPANDQKGCDRTLTGEPIDLFTGEEFLQIDDFIIPGAISLVWKRTYRSSNDTCGDLGFGWTRSYSDKLLILNDRIVHRDSENRRIPFSKLKVGENVTQVYERTTLKRVDSDLYLLSEKGKPDFIFHCVDGETCILTRLEDKRGNQVKFHYGSDLCLQLISTHSIGYSDKKYRVQSTHEGLIDSVTPIVEGNDLPSLIAYEYSSERDLVLARDAAGHAEKYEFRNHVITRRSLKTGYSFYFEWDQYNKNAKCLRNWGDDRNYNYLFHWDQGEKGTGVTNSLGVTQWYKFNVRGQLVQYVDGEAYVHRKRYDLMGQLVEKIDPEGNTTSYQYDEEKRLTSITDVLGHQFRFFYTDCGDLEKFIDTQGYEWTCEYDDNGQLVRSFDPLGNATEYDMTDGVTKSVQYPDGSMKSFVWSEEQRLMEKTLLTGDYTLKSSYEYDDEGRIVREKTLTDTVEYKYDENDRVVSVLSPQGATNYEYDALGNVVKIIHPDQKEELIEYNENGFITRYVDKIKRETKWFYEGLSQVSMRINPDGSYFYYEYDGERNLVGLINENGDVYRLVYDGNERLIEEIGFDGRRQKYEYNSLGHLLSKEDGGIRSIEFERDVLGRLVRLEANDGTFHAYSYTQNGQISKAKNNWVEQTFRYDPLGNLIAESQGEQVIGHQYDVMGRRVATITPFGRTINYEYDGLGCWSTVSFANELVAEVERNELGIELSRLQGHLQTESIYDPQDRLIKKTGLKNSETIMQRVYSYDNADRIQSIIDLKEGVKRFKYNPLDRIEEVAGVYKERFNFDPAGNILGCPSNSESVKLHTGNRVGSFKDALYLYDICGNLISESSKNSKLVNSEFQYDSFNQLVEVEQHGELFQFKYDCFGRRIYKKDGTGETHFLWDGDRLLVDSKNGVRTTYIYEPGTFTPLVMVKDDHFFFYHNDHLGTPLELTDKHGEIVWQGYYSALGEVVQKGENKLINPLRFQGQYEDERLNLYYNRHRYYSPKIGRFISQDPIGLLGGMNSYEYAPNTIHWVDPLGLCKESKPKGDQYVLGIHSNGNHANVSLTNLDTGESARKGKWPWMNPEKWSEGDLTQVLYDEGSLRGESSRYYALTPEQVLEVERLMQPGPHADSWEAWNNCVHYTQSVVESVTGNTFTADTPNGLQYQLNGANRMQPNTMNNPIQGVTGNRWGNYLIHNGPMRSDIVFSNRKPKR